MGIAALYKSKPGLGNQLISRKMCRFLIAFLWISISHNRLINRRVGKII